MNIICKRKFLHFLSILSGFLIIFSLICILETVLFGIVLDMWWVTICNINITPVLIIITSAYFSLKYVSYESKYSK